MPECASRSPPPRSLSPIETRYDDLILRLREAAQPDLSAPPALRAYVEKVRLHAYEVTDAEVQDLKDAGPTEDEIFEHTVSAAVAAGLERLDAALAVLE